MFLTASTYSRLFYLYSKKPRTDYDVFFVVRPSAASTLGLSIGGLQLLLERLVSTSSVAHLFTSAKLPFSLASFIQRMVPRARSTILLHSVRLSDIMIIVALLVVNRLFFWQHNVGMSP